MWQEGDGTASTGSPTPSGVGLGEAVGWHVSLWDRCPYKKRRGHQRRVALRVRPRDRTGVRRQGREAWPGSALLTARCGPPPLELRITVCCFGPRLSCFVRQPWQTKPTLFLSMAVHPVWEQECHTRSPCSRSPVHTDRWGKVTVWAEPQTPHLVAAVGREGRVGTSITRLPW